MTTPFQGGQALGEMIFGGRQRGNSDVFLQRLRENYNTQRAMDEAANSQIQRIARESIKSSDIAAARAGDLEAQARLGEAVLRAADTPNLRNMTGGFSDFDAAGYRRGAVEKARNGDMAGAQAELIGLADGPLKVNAIDAGYQLNPYEVGGKATPTQGKLGEIALSGAKVATEGARQDELGARASVSRAKAAAGGFAPSRGGGGGSSVDPAANVEFIVAEAERLAKTRGKAWAAAWAKKEAAKIGIHDLTLTGDFGTAPHTPGGSKPPEGGRPRPTPAAIEHLWKNPQLKAAFAEKYGPVAAEVAMQRKPK